MKKKLIKVALIGKTNAGKSTLINNLIGETVSITNKKINTTNESILGILNKLNTQIIFFDTPGSNFIRSNLRNEKKFKTTIWQAIYEADIIIYIVDILKYNYKLIENDILKIGEANKSIIFAFNKIDLVERKNSLKFINELKEIKIIKEFFILSAKHGKGINQLIKFLISKSNQANWIYNNNEISDKSEIFMSNECTRNAILKNLHKEIPYNIIVENFQYKILKNNNIKIKQFIIIENLRYKSIIIGKNGNTIKRIRQNSQKEIQKILNSKVHLYLQIINKDEI